MLLPVQNEQCACRLTWGLHFPISMISLDCLDPHLSLENIHNPKSLFFMKCNAKREVDRTCVCVYNELSLSKLFLPSHEHCKITASGSFRRPLGNLCYLQHNNNTYFTCEDWDCSHLFSIHPLGPHPIYPDTIIHFWRLYMDHSNQTLLSCDFSFSLAS